MTNNNIQIVNTTTFGEILNSYSPNVFQNTVFNDLTVFIDINNQCWFHGYKVAEKLGYMNPREAVRYHVHSQYKTRININELGSILLPNPLGGNPNITLIHEHGLYQLILSSKLPNVWQFQQWVYSVIENMRRYGIALSQQREKEMYAPAVIVPQYMRPIIDQMRDNMNNQKEMIEEQKQQIIETKKELNYIDNSRSQLNNDYNNLLNEYNNVVKINKRYNEYLDKEIDKYENNNTIEEDKDRKIQELNATIDNLIARLRDPYYWS